MVEKNILKVLEENPNGLSLKEISEKTGLSVEEVKKQLENLEKEGKIGDKNDGKPAKQEVKKNSPKLKTNSFDMTQAKSEIKKKLEEGEIKKEEAQILEQRAPVKHLAETINKDLIKKKESEHILTGVPGFDKLSEKGIPKGSSIIVAGGTGSGKTIFCMQALKNAALEGKKCLCMSFEESEERLISHMKEFGWDPEKLIKEGKLIIKRYSPFDIARNIEAILAKEKGELLIDIDPIILPKGFTPDILMIDSLTAIASAFTNKEDSYRIYIEQLFRLLEKLKTTSFLISETKQVPEVFSTTGVEEFLADGVIVLYSIKKGTVRENAIEILKLRGAKHQKRIVALEIGNSGITVYPDQEVFGDLSTN